MMDVFPQAVGRFRVSGVEITPQRRVLSARFGGGYSQMAEDGLNADESTYNITWENVPEKDADEIYNFLLAKLMITPFLIDIPKVGLVQVRCKNLRRAYTNHIFNSITAQLQRDYTLM
jgi:phage-related protein